MQQTVYFAHHSYVFQLPQCSHHQAAQRIMKRKFWPHKCSYMYKIMYICRKAVANTSVFIMR